MKKDSGVQDFRRKLDQDLQPLIEAGLKRQSLVELAEVLQYHLSIPGKEKIPCSNSLEVLMRAVRAIIAGEPEMGDYIAEKWRYALNNLPEELSKRMPSFAKAMAKH